MRKVLFATFVLVLAWAVPVAAQSPTPPHPPSINAIRGTVISKELRFPLDSEGWMGARVNVYRIDDNGWRQQVNSTNCWGGQGCVYSGWYWFDTDWNWQPLPNGTYEVEAVANYHILARTRVTLPTADQTNFELPLTPVYAEVLNSGPVIPSSGGKLTATIRVYNFNSSAGIISANTIVHGPGVTSEYATHQVNRSLPLGDKWTYTDWKFELDIERERPDGAMYCGQLILGHQDKPAEQYHQTWFCVPKGVTMDPVRPMTER